jgi:hypothetical protein
MLWKWARRRHPKKPTRWVKARYFRDDAYWTFQAGDAELAKPDATPITRFTKVTGRQTPYDPAHRLYWRGRLKTQVAGETYSKQRLMLHRSQEYMCALCGCARKAWERGKRSRKPFVGTLRVTSPVRQSWPAAGSESCVASG